MEKTRIILADDHTLVRAGIKSLLREIHNIEVVGEASNGREALELIEKIKPDLVLLDIAMAELNGLEVSERIHKENPSVKIIILSMHSNEEYIIQALKAGASGYLLKDAAPLELEMAIKFVEGGKIFLSPAISQKLVIDYLKRIGEAPVEGLDKPVVFDLLTSRQREILQLIAEGNSTKEIAKKLFVSVKTIETHRSQIMDRLQIHDIPGLVRYAIRKGLISSDK